MLKLEILNTGLRGRLVPLKHGLTIGSGADSKMRAQHPELQPIHARFYEEDGRPMVEIGCDEAHIHINGRDVVRSELRHDDELQIGPLRLRAIDVSRVSQTARLDDLIAQAEATAAEELHDFAREDLFYLATKDPAIRAGVSFSIPSKDRFIEQAQVFLARLAKGSGMEEPKVDAFMTCAKELILNAHRHGHRFDETKRIIIRYRDLGDRLRLIVVDEGEGFDHATVIGNTRKKDAASAARERYQAGGIGGLGFQLITRMSDELSYNLRGNEVTCTVMKVL